MKREILDDIIFVNLNLKKVLTAEIHFFLIKKNILINTALIIILQN